MKKSLGFIVVLALALVVASGFASADLQKVTLQIDGGAVPYYAFVYIAYENGFFADEGLDLEFYYAGAADIIQNVAVGNIDFGLPNADSVIVARSQGIPIRVVHTTYQRSIGATIFKPESGITGPADLAGKTVAVTSYGSPNYVQLQVMLQQNGLTLDDVEVEIVGTGAILNALVTDQVDAIVFSMLRTFELRDQGVDVDDFKSDDFLPSHGNVLIVSESLLAERPEVAAAFVRGLDRGLQYIIDGNTREAIEVAVNNYSPAFAGREDYLVWVMNEVYAGFLWQSDKTREYGLGFSDVERWTESMNIMHEFGIVEQTFDMAELLTNEFIGQ